MTKVLVVGRRTFERTRNIGPKHDPYAVVTLGVRTTYKLPWNGATFDVTVSMEHNSLSMGESYFVNGHRIETPDPVISFYLASGLTPQMFTRVFERKQREEALGPDYRALEAAAGWDATP